mgnify:CR=1 FL=1
MIVSNQELLEASIQVERAGKAFYAELSKHVKDPTAREFLKVMAQEEALHEEQFKEILAEKGDEPYGWENEEKIRTLLDNQFKTDIFPPTQEVINQLPTIGGIEKALDFAMDAERIVGEFFRLLHNSCNDIEIKTLLTVLEKSESEHLERVKAFKVRFLNESN